MTVIDTRLPGGTKGATREHWKEQMAEGLMGMCIAFLCEIMLAVPTIAFDSWKLFGAVVIMFVAIVMAAARVAYTIYKYAKV